jgi:glycosyltransferase involved in cell wall biosynthesis
MKILVIADCFWPRNAISSFRINAFARYLRQAGHSVTVITLGDREEVATWEGCEVHYLENVPVFLNDRFRWYRGLVRRGINMILSRATMDYLFFWRRRALREARKLFDSKGFDVVLSSYMPLSPHLVAMQLRRDGYKFRWIADMRDEMSRLPFYSALYVWRLKPYERRILDEAELVLSVSEPIINDFKAICGHDRFLEITNGYEYDEIHEVSFQPQFTMAYVGRFYYGIKPDNWFRAFSELIAEGRIPKDSRIKIIGDTPKVKVPRNIAENVFQMKGVEHSEAVCLSLEADVLVLVHPSGRKGVYTGKLFDYLATNKPILGLCDPSDVIADLLEETGAGFAVDESDIPGMKEMIVRCFCMWKNRVVLPRNWDKIMQYRRSRQVDKLIGYLDDL